MSGPDVKNGGPVAPGGGSGVPGKAPSAAGEVVRIASSMAAVCAVGALILGGVYLATERYAEAARKTSEREAVTQMLGLDARATVDRKSHV